MALLAGSMAVTAPVRSGLISMLLLLTPFVPAWVPCLLTVLSGEMPAMKKPRPKHTKAKTKARQGRVLVVTSGKGGVGKTTSTAALGAALAQSGQKVVVVDFDVGLRNLDLVMGAERRVVFDLINVIKGEAKLSQSLIRD